MQERQNEDAAAAWIARLAAHDATAGDRARFDAWLRDAPAHRAAFARMSALWAALGPVAKQHAAALTVRPRNADRRVTLAMAATIFVAIAGWLIMTQPTRIETQVGEQRVVALGDGSRIELNTRTRIELAYGEPQRDVTLVRGEAFFEVATDPGRPFTVTTPHGVITVVGTAFNVRVTGPASTVAVAEGVVRVSNGSDEVMLQASEAANLGPSVLTREATSDGHVAAWRHGRLDYVDVTLAELIDDLNRYVPVRMALTSDSLGDTRISASIRLEDQADMLRALAEILPLKSTRVGNDLILLQTTG